MTIQDRDLEYPWQQETIDSGLMLHAPATLVLDIQTLRDQAQAAATRIVPGMEGVCYEIQHGGGWSRLLLFQHYGADRILKPGLDQMPAAMELANSQGWQVQGIHLDRQVPGAGLPWHWDDQAVHLDAMRLLVPLHVPDGARTRVGHESMSYPPGQAWTADFSLVHDVWNLGTSDRISLVFDLAVTPEVTRLFPPELAADPQQRQRLASRTRDQLRQFWIAGGARKPYPVPFRQTV